ENLQAMMSTSEHLQLYWDQDAKGQYFDQASGTNYSLRRQSVSLSTSEKQLINDLWGKNLYTIPVGQPGFGESLIPVLGSGRAAVDHFQNGDWGWGLVFTGLSITDVFFVRCLVK